MSTKNLHIVDGESAGGTLRMAGFRKNAEILRWRDALYTGPVPAGLTLRQLSRVRSRFWTKGRSATELDQRDAELARHSHYENIVLWFEAECVDCQLSLIQILSWFREQGVAARRLTWVGVHGGKLRPEQIPDAYSSRRPITTAQMRLAERAWRAFRQPSPAGMVHLLRANLSCDPGLERTLIRLLQEYPGKRNGLSRLESRLLREIYRGRRAKAAAAVGSVLVKECVGNLLLFEMLRNFVRAAVPLLRFAEPFTGEFESYQFNGAILELTEVGRRVLGGKADHVALSGVDRWVGGVHLEGQRVRWRWDRKAGSIVAVRRV